MSVIIRLQGLPWSANALDIRNFFMGLGIPAGGVHIIGGEKGDSFIAFTTDEDARQAMNKNYTNLGDSLIKLFLSSKNEMQTVIEQARIPPAGMATTDLSSKVSEDSQSPRDRTGPIESGGRDQFPSQNQMQSFNKPFFEPRSDNQSHVNNFEDRYTSDPGNYNYGQPLNDAASHMRSSQLSTPSLPMDAHPYQDHYSGIPSQRQGMGDNFNPAHAMDKTYQNDGRYGMPQERDMPSRNQDSRNPMQHNEMQFNRPQNMPEKRDGNRLQNMLEKRDGSADRFPQFGDVHSKPEFPPHQFGDVHSKPEFPPHQFRDVHGKPEFPPHQFGDVHGKPEFPPHQFGDVYGKPEIPPHQFGDVHGKPELQNRPNLDDPDMRRDMPIPKFGANPQREMGADIFNKDQPHMIGGINNRGRMPGHETFPGGPNRFNMGERMSNSPNQEKKGILMHPSEKRSDAMDIDNSTSYPFEDNGHRGRPVDDNGRNSIDPEPNRFESEELRARQPDNIPNEMVPPGMRFPTGDRFPGDTSGLRPQIPGDRTRVPFTSQGPRNPGDAPWMRPRFRMDGPRFPSDGPRFQSDGPRFPLEGPRFPSDGPRNINPGGVSPRFMSGPRQRFSSEGPRAPFTNERPGGQFGDNSMMPKDNSGPRFPGDQPSQFGEFKDRPFTEQRRGLMQDGPAVADRDKGRFPHEGPNSDGPMNRFPQEGRQDHNFSEEFHEGRHFRGDMPFQEPGNGFPNRPDKFPGRLPEQSRGQGRGLPLNPERGAPEGRMDKNFRDNAPRQMEGQHPPFRDEDHFRRDGPPMNERRAMNERAINERGAWPMGRDRDVQGNRGIERPGLLGDSPLSSNIENLAAEDKDNRQKPESLPIVIEEDKPVGRSTSSKTDDRERSDEDRRGNYSDSRSSGRDTNRDRDERSRYRSRHDRDYDRKRTDHRSERSRDDHSRSRDRDNSSRYDRDSRHSDRDPSRSDRDSRSYQSRSTSDKDLRSESKNSDRGSKRTRSDDKGGLHLLLRHMPTSVSYREVRRYLQSSEIPFDGLKLINDANGSRIGTGYVKFAKESDATEALRKNGTEMNGTKIEIIRCSKDEFDTAIDSFRPQIVEEETVPPKRVKSNDTEETQAPAVMFPDKPPFIALLKGFPPKINKKTITEFVPGVKIAKNGDAIFIDLDQAGIPTGCVFVEVLKGDDLKKVFLCEGRTIGPRLIRVTLGSQEELNKAMDNIKKYSHLTEQSLEENLGKKEKIKPEDEPKQLPKQLPNNNNDGFCVCLSGLPVPSTQREVADFCHNLPMVTRSIHLSQSSKGTPIGEAFVEFSSEDAFKACLHRDKQTLGNFIINVSRISKSEMMSRTRQAQPMGSSNIRNPGDLERQAPPGMGPKSDMMARGGPPNLMNLIDNRNAGPPPPDASVDNERPIPPGVLKRHWFYLRCSNLPLSITIREILGFFLGHSPVPESIRLHYTGDGHPTGNAVVGFETRDVAMKAMHEMNNALCRNNSVVINPASF